jgi:hypothetical protein
MDREFSFSVPKEGKFDVIPTKIHKIDISDKQGLKMCLVPSSILIFIFCSYKKICP